MNSTSPTRLVAPAFEVGGVCRDLSSLPEAEAAFRRLSLPFNPDLLGCQRFHQAEESLAALASKSIARTLKNWPKGPQAIDGLIFASAEPVMAHALLKELLERFELVDVAPYASCGQECVTLLGAIDTASALVSSGRREAVLVVGCDLTTRDSLRIKEFGVASDAAASCIVSREESAQGLRIRSFAAGTCPVGLRGEDNHETREHLAKRVLADALREAKVTLGDIHKVFTTNFYKPIASFNATALGFREDQRHSSSSEYGHCMGADPLINLIHYQECASLAPGEIVMLQAYARGFYTSMLLNAEAEG